MYRALPLMDPTIASIFFLTLSIIIYYLSTRTRTRQQTPCPHSYPLIGFLRNRHRFHDWVAEMLSATPSLTLQVNSFLGLSHGVCTAHPSDLDHLLRSNFSNYVKGRRYNSVLDDLLGAGIFNADGELWLRQRKIASHEFNTKSLKQFISFTVQSDLRTRLLPHLSAAAACAGQLPVDLQDILRRFTFDNICEVAFGVDPNWLDTDMNSSNPQRNSSPSSSSSFVEAFDYAVEICSNRFMSPLPLIWKIKRFLNIGDERRFKEAVHIINDYAMTIILTKERNLEEEEGKQSGADLLSRFMDSSSSLGFQNNDEKRKFLRDIVISFILAGKDSTSTALTWFFWVISGHPRCESKIRSELVTLAGGKNPLDFSYDELKQLHYLHASLSESLRLFPPVPINSRLALSDDVLIGSGSYVGKGWFADYSAYAMGRMERVWGEDCWEFRPERWLDEQGMYQAFDPLRFPVFHFGPRICLGKEMAYMQMKSVAAAVMYEFEVVAVDGGGTPERVRNDPPYTLSLLLKMKGGLFVRLKRRQMSWTFFELEKDNAI